MFPWLNEYNLCVLLQNIVLDFRQTTHSAIGRFHVTTVERSAFTDRG